MIQSIQPPVDLHSVALGTPQYDIIKWKHFPRYWSFVRGTTAHRWIPLTMASDAELFFPLICAWTNSWANNRDAGDLRSHDVIVMPRQDLACWMTLNLGVLFVFPEQFTLATVEDEALLLKVIWCLEPGPVVEYFLSFRLVEATQLQEQTCGDRKSSLLTTFMKMNFCHYSNVIMSAMASQLTSLTIVYSTVFSGTDQRKHQSSASLAFVRGIHRWPVNSPHKRPVTRKMFPFIFKV